MEELEKYSFEEEIANALTAISGVYPHAEEYEKAVRNIKMLNDAFVDREKIRLEEERIKKDYEIRSEEIRNNRITEDEKLENSKRDRKFQYIKVGAVVCTTVCVGLMTIYAEEVRVITSKAERFASQILRLA